jgi:tetratricopeptide (TPR) repeat protein
VPDSIIDAGMGKRLQIACLAAWAVWAQDRSPQLREAMTLLQRGEFQAAEPKLRAEVAAHPDDAWTLSLLASDLDNLKKVSEADALHRSAVAKAPRSIDVLNNFAAHLWMAGKPEEASKVYEQILAVDPSHAGAHLQLARIDANAGEFAKALAHFEAALKKDPANFGVLYNLGIAATRAGRPDRAREVLEAALRQQPQNVDVLYALAYADHALRRYETAVLLLSQAQRLDPKRVDVEKMLAIATTDLGALDDASAAWDRYLKLAPEDDAARRERGYTNAQKGQIEQGLADLEWFAARHPEDAVGHYELGQAVRTLDMVKAMEQFDRALAIAPAYVPALMARGSLYYQEGKPEAAVKDLEAAAAARPDDAVNLDRLGQTYQALDRTAEAVRVLRRAAELAPDDSNTLLHFARALADAGETEESKAMMDRFRRLGPEKKTGVRGGFVEYLSLSDAERRADYRTRLEAAVRKKPDSAALQLEHLKLMVADGEFDRAEAAARTIDALKPGGAVLADAGRALLEGRRYGAAKRLLEEAKAAGVTEDIDLDLAIASGIPETALRALEQAIARTPERSGLYRQAAAILVEQKRAEDAARLLEGAAAHLPNDRETLLLAAAAEELAGKTDDAERRLIAIQLRWPEWDRGWAVYGVILARHQNPEEAHRALETAAKLGSRTGIAAARDPAYLQGLFTTAPFHSGVRQE